MLEATGDLEAVVGRSVLRNSRRWFVGIAAALLLLLGGPGLVAGASAAVFNVTGTADGVASCTGSGPFNCPSLRSAVIASNSVPGGNTINVPAGTYTLSIGPSGPDDATTGDLNVTASVTIAGAGSGAAGTTIVGSGDRIFDISAANATLSEMSITGGSQEQDGAGIEDSGSSLTLSNDALTSNTTTSLGFGGGLSMEAVSSAALTISNSSFTSNVAADTSSGGGGFGGAISFEASGGTMTVSDSTFASNTAQSGTAAGGGFGGAISFEPSGAATLTITGSTFSSNTAAGTAQGGFGGAIDFEPAGSQTHAMTITNSTLFGNTAGGVSGFGGAIDYEPLGATTATLTNDTIVGNAVNTAQQGGALDIEDAPMTIQNSIVSGNTAGSAVDNCAPSSGGTIIRAGHNIEQGTTCGFDINANPLLGSLGNNGGPTQTLALLAGSPAIDAALPALCPATDQRGVARPDQAGTACDIGAYEFVVTPPTTTQPPPTTTQPPHGTRIYKREISKKKHTAKFWFRASGRVKGFQCELRPYVAKKHRYRDGKWRACTSPTSFARLKHGHYLLEVRAYNGSGTDKKPTKVSFRI